MPEDESMSLTVAIQMDPIERVKIDADSTFALMSPRPRMAA